MEAQSTIDLDLAFFYCEWLGIRTGAAWGGRMCVKRVRVIAVCR